MNPPVNLTTSTPNKHLLEAIREIHGSVGDGLNDDEFTHFLQKAALPNEAGFSFLSYSNRFVTLGVPPQDLAHWYPPTGWIAAEKEKIAREIARKYGLLLCEPPDAVHTFFGSTESHHHLELVDRKDTVIVAHPDYLKIRLLVTGVTRLHAHATQWALPLGPDLLPDFSTLYLT